MEVVEKAIALGVAASRWRLRAKLEKDQAMAAKFRRMARIRSGQAAALLGSVVGGAANAADAKPADRDGGDEGVDVGEAR